MAITSRQELAEYCLRKLGAPVIQINVADEQIDDRIDDALQKYADFHYNGTTKEYYRYQIQLDDVANKYITLPDNIIGTTKIFPQQGFIMTGSGMFDVRYQIALNDLYTLTGTNLVPYYMTMTHLALMNELLVGQVPIRYNKKAGNKLYLDMDWNNYPPGSWLIVECYSVVDPDDFESVYDDIWLKQYVTALLKKQWGVNLSKFQGMPLPGGLVLNGERIIQEAEAELEKAEFDLEDKYMMPPLMQMG